MEGYILEWLNLLIRWAHLITGIAWIGASFYFVWLDNHLVAPKDAQDREKGVGGELWAVHGGGFYNAKKYTNGVPEMPEKLHWFKWEAYTTLISGFCLLALMYWYQAEVYLIDPSVLALPKYAAIGIGLLTIIGGWIAYDQLCRSSLGQKEKLMSLLLLVALTAIAWGLCQVFSGRGAYIHFGAMLGTIMVANVFFIIMPGQRAMVSATEKGEQPDPSHGKRAKQRSVHNTYFTLPVLFVMISNHYAMTWGHEYNWAILIGISLIGALIRVHFVQAHFGKPSVFPLSAAALILAAIIAALAPDTKPSAQDGTITTISTGEMTVSLETAHSIIESRCTSCHAQNPAHPGFSAAPKGIVLETPEHTLSHANAIYQQSVLTRAMPIGNLTQITDEERMQLKFWYEGLP